MSRAGAIDLSTIQEILSDAAVDPLAWRRALEKVTSDMGAKGALLIPLKGKVPGQFATGGMEETADIFYREGWAERDARKSGIPKLIETGITADQDFITPEQMKRHPFWQEFLEPIGLRWFCGLLVNADDDLWCLALQRTPEQGAFLPEEQASLAKLAAPLSRSATLSRRLEQTQIGEIGTALDLAGRACCLLDRSGRVLQVNERASALLRKDLVVYRRELLAIGRSDLTSRIASHISAVLYSPLLTRSAELSPVVIPRAGRRPLIVEAHLLRRSNSDPFGLARVIVFLTEPRIAAGLTPAKLETVFGLKTGEAKVAVELANARPLPEACNRLGLKYETGKSYLKSVFAKLGVKSQIELVALLASLAGM